MATEKQEYKTTISQSSKCIDDYGIPSKCIQTTYGEDISLESVCRHIRNAIAHCHFTFNCKNSREIDAIVFHDQNPYNTSETSNITVRVENFRKFATKIADIVIKNS